MDADPRKRALVVLNELQNERRTLEHVIANVLDRDNVLSGRDRAFAQTLIYGVLRWRKRLDWLLERFSKSPLDRIEPAIMNLLRLGLFQIVCLTRVPVSAAVNTSVEMAKSISAPWVVRFVNAILRRASRESQQIKWPDLNDDPEAALSVTRSMPKWLIRKWLGRFGVEETTLLCDALNETPPITVRANSLKTDRTSLIASLKEDVLDITPCRYAPDGVHFYSPVMPILKMKTFQDGWFQVQDEAAQLVARFLDPQPGENILDACAGRGGKTGCLAQLMKDQGRIVAMDIDERKLISLQKEMKRLGISIVTTCKQDLDRPFDAADNKSFDRILLDAPCSGLGVLRRHPDARWRSSKKNLNRYQQKQLMLLKNIATAVKQGGLLIYAVCSNEPEENEAVIESFLKARPQFAVGSCSPSGTLDIKDFIDPDGCMRTFPHRHQMDGFFAAPLKRVS